ncbi:MAG: PQQ-binding-like beta-propeller repeat protein [Sphingomonadales bacterium]
MRNLMGLAAALAAVLGASAAGAAGAPEHSSLGLTEQKKDSPGGKLYAASCASCHETGVSRAPHPRMLQFLSPDSIYRAMTEGVMKPQAAHLSDAEKRQVAEYLTNRKLGSKSAAAKAPQCEGQAAVFDYGRPPPAPNWGLGYRNNRFVPTERAGITRGNVGSLKLKWAFAFPGALRARSHPGLAGGAIYVGSQDGTVYALDRATGCVRWMFRASAEVRTGIVVSPWKAGDAAAQPRLYFGDLIGNVYSLDAVTGKQVWRAHPDEHPSATITGTPTLHNGRLYVPVSSLEVVPATDPAYACCTFRGSVAALEAATGKPVWQTYTIDETPAVRGKNAVGTDRIGPSGAPIWNSPAIDEKRGQLYVGTGENYSSPATATSDSIIAMDLKTGRKKWIYQATAGDAWNSACVAEPRHNCPEENGPDFDFGAAMVLARTATGRELVLGPQKSGVVHAVDPDTGKLVWQVKLGRGGLHGGVHFGVAADDSRVFVPISDAPDTVTYEEKPNPGLFALDLETGAQVWQMPLKDECDGREFCAVGNAAAITATPELVFAGALDGWFRAHDASTGKILWKLDTTEPVRTVSGEMAHGGSMDGAAAALPDRGQLFVSSGYNFAGHMPGNVLLVFEAPGR